MTNRQKIALRLSEVRKRLNEIAGIDGDDFNDEIRSELDTLKTEYAGLEERSQAAIIAEGEAETRASAGFKEPDAEDRELAELRGKARVGAYIEAAFEGRAVADGAEHELNQALDIPANRFPLELLAPAAVEQRATTNADAATMQGTWLDRLFSDTAAMRLGVTMESVAPGIASFPVVTAGASAAQRGRTEPADDTAWTVGVTDIKPTRNAVRAVSSEEDAARLPGLEAALRRDLSMALTEGVDRAIFLGDAGANEDSADITGLANVTASATGLVEATLTQGNKVKGPETLAVFAGMVDGKHAASLDDLRIVASVGANTLWLSTIAAATADTKTLASFFRENGLSWTIRGDIDTATSNGDFGAFVGRGRGIRGAAVAAVWNSGQLIRDPYTNAAKGEVTLTLSYLWGFALPRPSSFARLKFVT